MNTSNIALAAALALIATPALADEAPKPDKAAADTAFTVGEIVVTANRMAGSTDNVLTSVDRLGGDVAQRANVNYAWELVGRLPGVLITNFNQGATSGKFSFRGFNGEGFAISLGVGETMAELIATGATSTPIAAFSIGRFAPTA